MYLFIATGMRFYKLQNLIKYRDAQFYALQVFTESFFYEINGTVLCNKKLNFHDKCLWYISYYLLIYCLIWLSTYNAIQTLFI